MPYFTKYIVIYNVFRHTLKYEKNSRSTDLKKEKSYLQHLVYDRVTDLYTIFSFFFFFLNIHVSVFRRFSVLLPNFLGIFLFIASINSCISPQNIRISCNIVSHITICIWKFSLQSFDSFSFHSPFTVFSIFFMEITDKKFGNIFQRFFPQLSNCCTNNGTWKIKRITIFNKKYTRFFYLSK